MIVLGLYSRWYFDFNKIVQKIVKIAYSGLLLLYMGNDEPWLNQEII